MRGWVKKKRKAKSKSIMALNEVGRLFQAAVKNISAGMHMLWIWKGTKQAKRMPVRLKNKVKKGEISFLLKHGS